MLFLVIHLIHNKKMDNLMNKDIEAGIVSTHETKKTKSWFIRIMSVLLTDKAIRMRGGGGKKSINDYYEIV
jgi:hypothetical protein